jgi:Ca-activated chloride channel family protein
MRHLRSARSILASKADSAQRPHFTFVRVLSVIIIFASHLMAQSYSDQVHVEPRADFLEGSVDASLHTNSKPFVSNVDLVLVPVTVSNSMNRVVLGLDKENFQIFDNKKQQVIEHFSSDDVPISIAIVFDTSGSMASNHKIERAREAVAELLKTSNPADEVMLISVADKPQLLTDFTMSIETVDGELVSLLPKGSTALLDGIYLAISRMKNARYSRKALLIISDGGDNHSRYNEREIVDLVKESDLIIYSIGIYDEFFQSEEERLGPQLMSEISELTGGRLFIVNNPNDLAEAAAKVGAELRSAYVLGYRPAIPLRDGKWHRIRVKLLTPKGFPRVQVNAKQGYYAPSR